MAPAHTFGRAACRPHHREADREPSFGLSDGHLAGLFGDLRIKGGCERLADSSNSLCAEENNWLELPRDTGASSK